MNTRNTWSITALALLGLAPDLLAAPSPQPPPISVLPFYPPWFWQGTRVTFCHIAREFMNGPGSFDAEIPPALSSDHKVAFVSSTPARLDLRQAHVGDGTYLHTLDTSGAGFTALTHIKVNAGALALVATRTQPTGDLRGVYTASLASAPAVSFHALYESPTDGSGDPVMTATKSAPRMVINTTGQIAFTSISDSRGAIYRGPVSGPVEVLRAGDGTFFNAWAIDLNDAGSVSANMEYSDPTSGKGLTYGVLDFDRLGQDDLHDITAPLEHTGLGNITYPRVNNGGEVVFFTNVPLTGRFFTPPDVWSPTPTTTITLTPGVYKAQAKPWGQPWVVTRIVDASGPYDQFSAADISSSGLVVFEASLDDGGQGVFFGADPDRDAVLRTGWTFESRLISSIKLGELNDYNEVSIMTGDSHTSDKEIWRVGISRGTALIPTSRALNTSCTE